MHHTSRNHQSKTGSDKESIQDRCQLSTSLTQNKNSLLHTAKSRGHGEHAIKAITKCKWLMAKCRTAYADQLMVCVSGVLVYLKPLCCKKEYIVQTGHCFNDRTWQHGLCQESFWRPNGHALQGMWVLSEVYSIQVYWQR